MKSAKRPIAIDLYCGAGGMSVGIERAGFDIALAIDYDGYHVATHARNFPYGRSVCSSVTDLNADDIRALAKCKGEIDLVFGGPPCQGFSNMGLRDAQDPRNSLIFHFARLVRELSPKAFIMENVPGLNTGSTIPIFQELLSELSKDYNIADPVRVLNALDFGVPQDRKRLFILGVRKDLSRTPEYTPAPIDALRPTVSDAIADLPDVESKSDMFSNDIASYDKEPSHNALYALIARGLVENLNDYSRKRIWNRNEVSGCMRTNHTQKAIELYSATSPGSIVPGHKLPRLHPEGICPTLRSGATSERGSHTAPRPIHPVFPRVITAREAARLHGYPDWFSFYPAKMHACRQIGNSVCPPVAHAAGLAIIHALGIDPSMLDRTPVELNNEFPLPEDRPRQHARIPVKVEFPKVINHIWEKAYDKSKRKLISPLIDHEAIKDAIAITGAKLPRVRPERFLYEAGQQRAIRDILALPLSYGYSIAITDKTLGVGRFQDAELESSLGRSNAVTVRSSELNNATVVKIGKLNIERFEDFVSLIELDSVISSLTGGNWLSATVSRDLFGKPEISPSSVTISTMLGKSQNAIIQIFDGSSVPHARIAKLHSDSGKDRVILLLRLTRKHFAISVANVKGKDGVTEEFRHVFNLIPSISNVRSVKKKV